MLVRAKERIFLILRPFRLVEFRIVRKPFNQ